MEFLTVQQLEKLKQHKYAAEGRSLLEPLIFQPFWEWTLKYVPLTWAPNAMTLSGLILNALSCVLLIFCSPHAEQEYVPPAALFFSAVCIFVYQTLDALDGKQARRTKSANSLGELFDHGCDAVSEGLYTLSIAVALRLGTHPNALFAFGISCPLLYYSFHWRGYCSGKLLFGLVDVTEAQVLAMSILVVSGLFGTEFWAMELFGVELKILLVSAYFVYCFFFLANILYHIFVVGGCGRHYTTVANSSVLSPFPPLFFVLALVYYCRSGSYEHLFERLPLLFLSCYMIVVAKLSCRLIVAMMTRSNIVKFDSSMLALLLILASEYVSTSLLPESTGLLLAFIYALVDFCKYSTSVCRQIADFLGVYCLSLDKPPVTTLNTSTSNSSIHSNTAVQTPPVAPAPHGHGRQLRNNVNKS